MPSPSTPESPYLAARQEWNERYGSYVRAAAAWRTVGIIALAMAVVSSSYALYQSTQVKLVPYIVEVDKLGTAASGGYPQQIEYADPRVVRATLGSFISAFRSVTPDTVVQKRYIDRAYAMLRTSDPATEKVNGWFRSNSPFEKAKGATVAVEVNNIVALSPQSWQIDWTEFERDRQGKELAARRFRGVATVTLTPPQDEGVIRLNPIGLYLKDFDWTAQL
ncbi:conjugal transfer protein TrbF [Xanthobacter sp. DSM 24535]|uniref:Type IV secretion system protein VirB5 n=1 Tax=Aquabacter spiritensis TaxID=933073 RepID=A0A4R3LQ95_9HYPH|nr:conjugal transfer protein TrbF [Aquabacter spiritensis]OYX13002.1 MAG: conjugal transfer protein TrbF [Rhizobiales bacterium 32-66-8]TCT01866.1 type IV secretion system protein VirB5 [Aquabacter spiritensis]